MPIGEDPLAIAVDASAASEAVVRLTGELDLATGPMLAARLSVLLAEGCDVVIDLAGLSFMDSSGLSVLIGAHQEAAPHGRIVRLVGATGMVARVLTISGADQVLDVVKPAGSP